MSEIKCDGKICGLGKHIGGGHHVCPHNNLFVLYPELCKEWDYEKNDKHPSEFTSGSGKKVWWICKINQCSWDARIYDRVGKNSKCKYLCEKDVKEDARICNKCNIIKDMSEFGPKVNGKFGKCSICHQCQKIYAMNNRNTFDGFMGIILTSAEKHANFHLSKGRKEAGIFDLTLEQLVYLWARQNGKCYYSGIPIVPLSHSNWQCSLERLDDNLGYIMDNVAFICLELNVAAKWTLDKIKQVPLLTQKYYDNSIISKEIDNDLNKERKGYSRRPIVSDNRGYIRCNKCDIFKLRTEFHEQISGGCKDCQRLKGHNNRDTMRGTLRKLLGGAKGSSKYRDTISDRVGDNKIDITFKDLSTLLRNQYGRCAYSNIKMNYGSKDEKDWVCSLERIDVTRGYVKDNICLICAEFNGTDTTARLKYKGNGGSGGWNKEKFNFFLSHITNKQTEENLTLNLQRLSISPPIRIKPKIVIVSN